MSPTVVRLRHPGAGPASSRGRADLIVTIAALLVLLAWDASGADLALTRLFADSGGFPWRESFVTSRLLHDGGRLLAAFALLLQTADVAKPFADGPSRLERAGWLAIVGASLLLVPALKQLSRTSCPWDLAEFGGPASYVPHWVLGAVDGGPGHCFPSGHAVAAFGFIGLYFLWRDRRPAMARAFLAALLVAGVVLGAGQLARGAHYASHTLWSAWLCWSTAAASHHLAQAVRARVAAPTQN